MHRIVVNLCLKWQKNFRRQEAISLEEWLEDLDELPLELLSTEEDSARETAEVLQDALSHLPERQRQVVELRLQGYSVPKSPACSVVREAPLTPCSIGHENHFGKDWAKFRRAIRCVRKRVGCFGV